MKIRQIALILVTTLLFLGCSAKNENFFQKQNELKTKSDKLYSLVVSISDKIDKKEALSLAKNSVSYAQYLGEKYQAVRPAIFNNFLINIGIKKRGLCYQYANDLLFYLKTKKYKSFDIIKIVADKEGYFEHNSLLVTRDDIDFKDSIVLDAWRYSGELYFSKVKDDTRYEWEIR